IKRRIRLGGRKKMAAVKELIRAEADGSISFGDYELASKTKKQDFEYQGDLYKVKTSVRLQSWSAMICLCMSLFPARQWSISARTRIVWSFRWKDRRTLRSPWVWKMTPSI